MAEPAEVAFAIVDASSAGARTAMGEYFAELDRRLAGGFTAGGAIDAAVTAYNPPAGVFLVGVHDDAIVACGALNWLDDATAEVKRMWVDPRVRGIGLGRRLLTRLEDEARRTGRTRMVLDTSEELVEAITLYGRLGYRDIEPYNDNPDAERWFEKRLP